MYVVRKFLHSDKTINIFGVVVVLACIIAALMMPNWAVTYVVPDEFSYNDFLLRVFLRTVAYIMIWTVALIFGIRLSFFSSHKD
ncbi:hypothetical protein LH991_07605 [Schleiferilactobacillus harbinensis]|jgi:hypothetical protein|uniref:Uncharacterized protein n=2 Tax=Schleiferilactobacillus harbinensis TaxID=304207 RepID=A0A510TZ69_9LACO|nr:hypothetical protein [Schleiferilactobacillus harbinensis]HAY53129.1 hypothetical protein [Lactobacillus sp.]KRM29393.1 hypothetical protein FC91_GL000747 [Schleiferilactobacillus harbinensis DSM 16991]MBO3091899.1 hypothetical protein [Schleiferilactobacillus harbinensis]MCT2908073.1 hypothetical protein [Schleiferilactobacillus harbinensis]QFR22291.1 hypothetical protein D1010_01875 [Schleiferilactobacillus harbinensis]